MSVYKQLTLHDRHAIALLLDREESISSIARELGKHPSTVTREIKRHCVAQENGGYGAKHNNCQNRKNCSVGQLCAKPNCRRPSCCNCTHCDSSCPFFILENCPRLALAPYVCNGCQQRRRCTLTKQVHRPILADNSYRTLLVERRSGFALDTTQVEHIDQIIWPGLRHGQSLHHIHIAHQNELPCSIRTIYRRIDAQKLAARNIDLPRKVRFKQRRKVRPHKIDTACRVGRTYLDFCAWREANPDTAVVQMDSVIGGKAILSVHWEQAAFCLFHLREHNDAASIIAFFNDLDQRLGRELFQVLFPVILTDNGSEFSNPNAIEFDAQGLRRTRIFYCDPSMPAQKAGVEGANAQFRRILPKGSSFDNLTTEHDQLAQSHLNALKRKKLNGLSAFETFSFLLGPDILDVLGVTRINPDQVTLKPFLLGD